MQASPSRVLVALLIPVLGFTALFVAAGPVPEDPARSLPWLVLASAAWAVCLMKAPRVALGRGGLVWILLGALALRVVVLAGDPQTSDDVHRYAWEGGLVLEGVSPYALAPEDAGLGPMQVRWPTTYAGINHREVSAAYPPVAQATFAAVVALAGGVEQAAPWMRVVFGLADLLVLAPLALLIRSRGRSPACLVAWAWSPLVALEFAGAGHLDSLGILMLVAALATLGRGRASLAAGLLSLGALIKLLPALVLPFALRRAPKRGQAALAFGLPLLAALVLVGSLEGGLGGLGRGLGEYGLRWEAASLVYRFIEPVFGAAFAYDEAWSDPRRLGRAAVLVVWLGMAGLAWKKGLGPVDATFLLLAAFLVLSPTLHPWYLAWIVPFLALRAVPGLLWLVVAAPLLYWPLHGWVHEGAWREPVWLWPVVACPALILLLLELRSPSRCAP